MPVYDFRCRDCEHTFEAWRPVDRRDDAPCPECGSANTRRAMPRVYAYVKGAPAAADDGCGAEDGCCGGDCGDEGGCGGACSCGAADRA